MNVVMANNRNPMKRIVRALRVAALIAAGIIATVSIAGCAPKEAERQQPEAAQPPATEDGESSVEPEPVAPEGLGLNRAILESLGKPMAGILRAEPGLEPQFLSCVDAAAMCFVDPAKPYSYILFITQYLPYDEDAAEAIEECDIRCEGIYTTASELFTGFAEGEAPAGFFDKPGIEDFSVFIETGYGIGYFASFIYEGMRFQAWGGDEGSPAVLGVTDIATVTVTTQNEKLINEYHNDKAFPDGIGCAEAIRCAKEYRVSNGKQDCGFSIMRDGIIDATEEMGLPDKKVYIVSPELGWEGYQAEKHPVYYVGFSTGGVFERFTLAD